MTKLTRFKKYSSLPFLIIEISFIAMCVGIIIDYLRGYPVDTSYFICFVILCSLCVLGDALKHLEIVLTQLADHLEEKVKEGR